MQKHVHNQETGFSAKGGVRITSLLKGSNAKKGLDTSIDKKIINLPTPKTAHKIKLPYTHINNPGDGRCSLHAGASALSMNTKLFASEFVKYIRKRQSELQMYLEDFETATNTAEYKAYRETQKCTDERARERWGETIANSIETLPKLEKDMLNLMETGKWRNNNMAKGAEAFEEFVKAILAKRGHKNIVIAQRETDVKPMGTSLSMNDVRKYLNKDEIPNVVEALKEERLILFITVKNGHWHTILPNNLKLPQQERVAHSDYAALKAAVEAGVGYRKGSLLSPVAVSKKAVENATQLKRTGLGCVDDKAAASSDPTSIANDVTKKRKRYTPKEIKVKSGKVTFIPACTVEASHKPEKMVRFAETNLEKESDIDESNDVVEIEKTEVTTQEVVEETNVERIASARWILPVYENNYFVFKEIKIRNNNELYATKEMSPGVHIPIGGVPKADRQEQIRLIGTADGENIWFLRNKNGKDSYNSQRSFGNPYGEYVAVKGGPEAKGLDIATFARQDANPNCAWINNALVTIKDVKENECLTVPFDQAAERLTYSMRENYRLLGFPVMPQSIPDSVPRFANKEIAYITKIIITAYDRSCGNDGNLNETFVEAIEQTIALGIMPRNPTMVTLAPSKELNPALAYVSAFVDKTYVDAPGKAGSSDLKAMVTQANAGSKNIDVDLAFKIFEVALSTDRRDAAALKLQTSVIILGLIACKARASYIETFANKLLTLLADGILYEKEKKATSLNVILLHLSNLAKLGIQASAHMALWLGEVQNFKRVQAVMNESGGSTASKKTNMLLEKLQTSLGMLHLTPNAWIKICNKNDSGRIITSLAEGNEQCISTNAPSKPDKEIRCVNWNANGFKSRLEKGEFANFLTKVKADVIMISEVKCAPSDIPFVRQLYKGLMELGYVHIVWNWCVERTGSLNTRHAGTMILAKYIMDDVQFGLGTQVDKQGRCITASIENTTIVSTYVPCTPLDEKDPRNEMRQSFENNLKEHMARLLQEDAAVFWAGDINIAPLNTDSSLSIAQQNRCPSTTNAERRRHAKLMSDLQLKSVGLSLQKNPPWTWCGAVPIYGPRKQAVKLRMRIDDIIAKADRIGIEGCKYPRITSMETLSNMFGSDHKPLTWNICLEENKQFEGKETVSTEASVEEQQSTEISETPETSRSKTGSANERQDESNTNNALHATVISPCESLSTIWRKILFEKHALPDKSNERQDEEADTETNVSDQNVLDADIYQRLIEAQVHKERVRRRPRGKEFDLKREMMKMTKDLCHQAASANRMPVERDNNGLPYYTPYKEDGTLPHNSNQKCMPEMALEMTSANGRPMEVLTLFDTGAFFNLMAYKTTKELGLRIYKRDDEGNMLTLPYLLFADNHSDKVMGCVDVIINFEGKKMKVVFFVMRTSPYPAFIGSHFMTNQAMKIMYKTGTIDMKVGKTTATLPFDVRRSVSIPFEAFCTATSPIVHVTAAKRIEIPPNSIKVPIPVRWSNIPRNMIGQWGVLSDAKSYAIILQNGITNTEGADDENFACYVYASNMSERAVTIDTLKPLCGFRPLGKDTMAMDASKLFEENPVENATPTNIVVEGQNDLETEWAKYPHIHKIRIGDFDNENESSSLTDRVRWMLIRNEIIWNPTPKEVSKNLEEYIIPLENKPVPGRTRPFNPHQQEAMKGLIEKQLAKKIIEPSNSPYSSPIVLVPKPDGRMRFVVDYRNINKSIAVDRYTTPRVEVALSVLHGNKYYSALDLVDAFWSIPLQEESRAITAFQTPDGLFQYRFLPQGLKTASAVFCRYMDRMLGALKWTEVLTYVDDILVFSKNYDDHLQSLERVCQSLRKFNMTMNPAKCTLFQSEVKYLGHVVSRDGVKCDPGKVKAIREMETPQTKETLHSTICKFRYYRRFIMDYAKIEEPLRKKTHADNKWTYDTHAKAIYTAKEMDAFGKLRNALCSNPILAHPDWSKQFVVHTDACTTGLGAVLVQMEGDIERVICYASRSLTKPETNYSIWELECLAMLWACRVYRMYLLGSKFKIITDSMAAKHVMNLDSEKASGRLLRWSLALQDFDFTIDHRKGKRHANADGLSRMPLSSCNPYDEGPTLIEPVGCLDSPFKKGPMEEINTSAPAAMILRWKDDVITSTCGANVFFPPVDKEAYTAEEFAKIQEEDEYCIKLRKRVVRSWQSAKPKQFYINKLGLLSRKSTDGKHMQVVVPVALRAFVLRRYHGLPVSGHLGKNKVVRQITQHYYWPAMKDHVAKWINACLTCARRKRTRNMNAADPGRASNAEYPWHKIAIDTVMTGQRSKDGYTVILTILDVFTRWVLAIPLRKATGDEVSKALFKHVFCMFGKPKEVISDNGSEFMNSTVKIMLEKWDIRYHFTGGYQPQACPVERYHRFMNNVMTMLCNKYGADWPEYLSIACFVYNSSTCEATGYTPYELVFCAREPTLLHELDLDGIAEELGLENAPDANNNSGNAQAFRQEAYNRLQEIYLNVREKCERMHRLNKEATLEKQGKKQKQRARYQVGDQVLFWEPQQTQYMQKPDEVNNLDKRPSKWTQKWTGPHTITKVIEGYCSPYIFFHTEKCIDVQTHANRLCAYQPWSDGITSTSFEIDIRRRYRTGEWVKEGALVLIPLERPYPFGIAKMLKCSENGDMNLQWLGNAKNTVNGKFEKGWKKTNGTIYYNNIPKNISDEPYTIEDSNIRMNQRDVIMHDFDLTISGYLPKPLIRAIEKHPLIWYVRKEKGGENAESGDDEKGGENAESGDDEKGDENAESSDNGKGEESAENNNIITRRRSKRLAENEGCLSRLSDKYVPVHMSGEGCVSA